MCGYDRLLRCSGVVAPGVDASPGGRRLRAAGADGGQAVIGVQGHALQRLSVGRPWSEASAISTAAVGALGPGLDLTTPLVNALSAA
jgi:hypothetical protein